MVEAFPRVLADIVHEKAVDIDETLTKRPANNIEQGSGLTHCESNAVSGENGGGNSQSSPEMLLTKPLHHHSRSTKMFVPSQFPAGEALMQHVVFTFSKDPFQKIR